MKMMEFSNAACTNGETGSCAELMPVRCAYCGNWMDVKPGKINAISHGACPECYERELRRLKVRKRARPPSP